jgi:hypothetical protein
VPLDCRSNAALVKQSVTCMTGWLASIGK